MLMSDIEIITDGDRRRRWSAAENLRIIEETLQGHDSISAVALRNGVAPNLLYRWRKLMLEGGGIAVSGDNSVTSNRTVREMEARICEFERQLGRKTLEVEILQEALDKARSKKRSCMRCRRDREVSGDDGGKNPGRVALQPEHALGRRHQAASALSQGARRGAVAADRAAGGAARFRPCREYPSLSSAFRCPFSVVPDQCVCLFEELSHDGSARDLGGFSGALQASYLAFMSGLNRMATSAGM